MDKKINNYGKINVKNNPNYHKEYYKKNRLRMLTMIKQHRLRNRQHNLEYGRNYYHLHKGIPGKKKTLYKSTSNKKKKLPIIKLIII